MRWPRRERVERLLESDSMDSVTEEVIRDSLQADAVESFLTELVQAKEHPKDRRSAAVWILGHTEVFEAMPALREVLLDDSDDASVRAEAARSFALLKLDPFEVLADLVKDESQPDALRSAALWSLGFFHIDNPKTVAHLVETLSSAAESFAGSKSLAIDLLGSADPKIDAVRITAAKALGDDDPEVQFFAINTVCQLGLVEETREALEALRDSDAFVKGWGSISEKAHDCLSRFKE